MELGILIAVLIVLIAMIGGVCWLDRRMGRRIDRLIGYHEGHAHQNAEIQTTMTHLANRTHWGPGGPVK